jgi:predicted GNAT family acetyltransferase
MTGSPIIRQDLGHRGRYVQMLDGEEAELTFVRVGAEQIIIDHTEVPPRFRGRGIGEALVAHAAGEARLRSRPVPRPSRMGRRPGALSPSGCRSPGSTPG